MKFISQFLIIGMLCFSLQLFFPWWSLVAAAFAVGVFYSYRNAFFSFLAGFLGAGLLWFGYAFWLNWQNLGLLASKVGDLLQGIGANGILLVTALLAGTMAGMGALTGTLLHKALFPPREPNGGKP